MFGDLFKDRKKFFYVVSLYALLGANGGIVFAYFAYYFMNVVGVRDTLMYMNLGAAGILLIPLYKKVIAKMKTYNTVLVFINIILLIADSLGTVGAIMGIIIGTFLVLLDK